MTATALRIATWNTQSPHLTAQDALQRLHWSVFPLDAEKKPPIIPGRFKEDGTPMRIGWKKYQTSRVNPRAIHHWNEQYKPHAWSVITGKISDLILLDFDDDAGRETLARLGLNPHVRTGSGGYHQYFKYPGWYVPTLNSKTKLALGAAWPGLDIRGDGGYAAFCGSNTEGRYTWLRDPELDLITMLPDELRDMLGLLHAPDAAQPIDPAPRKTTVGTPGNDLQRKCDYILEKYLKEAGSRGRDNACFEMAVQLRDNDISESEAITVAREFARRVHTTDQHGHIDPFTDEEASIKVKSAYTRSARQAWESRGVRDSGNGGSGYYIPAAPTHPDKPFNPTDLGNAERFALRYKDTVRWCETWNTWLVFNGKCWEHDKTGRVDQLAKIIVRGIYSEAAKTEDEDLRKRLAKHAAASESNRSVRAMLDRSKSELPAAPEDFNTHLYLLNCENGTLDLQTGELRPHASSDMLTRCIKIKYNPLAKSERWQSFLEKFLDADTDLIRFMQQALGMSLCGDTSEQCLFICHGMGSNGKTTMLETVRIIMASYAVAANIETFQVRKNETIGNDIAELYGARLVTASETKLGGRLNEAFVKKATGKEPLRARRLRENEFEFMPEFTLWLAVNHKPVVLDTSKGMWRRVHFVPFNVTIEDQEADKHFGDKLLEEAEGILAWLVQGCKEWIKQGRLIVPEIVKEATAGYRAEMDIVANFLRDECIFSVDMRVGTKQLIERFESWCGHNSEKFDAKILKNNLKEKGYSSKRGHGGAYIWPGIGLVDNSDNADNELWVNVGEGSEIDLSSKGEPGERGEAKNRVNQESKNPPDATLNSRSPRSPRSPTEHETSKKSESTFTQEIKQSEDDQEKVSTLSTPEEHRELYRQLQTHLLHAEQAEYAWNATETLPRSVFCRRIGEYLKSGSKHKTDYALKLIERELGEAQA